MVQGGSGESDKPAGAVFLSYASEDAPAAQRICAALRAAGVEVWFDQSELRGGDAWDQSIRRQIKSCALFIPLVSRATHAREEGYFRLEWKLAIDRSHLIMSGKAFLLPVAIDDTPQGDDHVPDRFREVQWTRLPAGETGPEFVDWIRRLLTHGGTAAVPGPVPRQPAAGSPTIPPPFAGGPVSGAGPASGIGSSSGAGSRPGSAAQNAPPARAPRQPLALWIIAGVLAIGCAYLLVARFLGSHPESAARNSAAPPSAVTSVSPGAGGTPPQSGAFSPPAHSIAVLPFVNLSGDPKQEYFSDGLTEELLNSLAEIPGLQVAARTSAFSFKGQETDIGTIARKLNVATVLEGSVRRSERTMRITAQLIDAKSGFHVWSKTYDRDLGDVLKLQTEIATAVAGALQVTLLGDASAKIQLGGTRNPAAFDAFLRARQLAVQAHTGQAMQAVIETYSEAIRLDPSFALAFANRSTAFGSMASEYATGSSIKEYFDRALADASRALDLAPDLAEAHLAISSWAQGSNQFRRAADEMQRAETLAPGSARVARAAGTYAVYWGRFDAAFDGLRRAQTLDPLNNNVQFSLGQAYFAARRYEEAITHVKTYLLKDADDRDGMSVLGLSYVAKGDLDGGRKTCESMPDQWATQLCLAIAYDKLGRHDDSERMIAKMNAAYGASASYQYSQIYAQRGDIHRALESLDAAVRVHDPGLVSLKTDPLLDPLRKEPRFLAILKQLDFPD
jgi:TolB-like protein/Flp pilus assembly protein TadD